jgi:hypothetical protein
VLYRRVEKALFLALCAAVIISATLRPRPAPSQTTVEISKRAPAGAVAELRASHIYKFQGEFAYAVPARALEEFADNLGKGLQSPFVVYEDDQPLGPSHTLHADISKLGHGRFSHWTLIGFIISSSDGTNPASNGRKYWVVRPPEPAEPISQRTPS